ncbi:MAG: peptidase M16 [Cytophagales bacterium CG12_big_fil_rev_8_21_14_0_65_40_12]|nr:MAG: peptidase M16 [Cytophagales bacterium CG12_big_fil_rev_8_21_14_0_65_40_12]PIW06082.1 MAG: peptidase M16 [Cytophagales bacterium CG17_big_fil_post_rev_8_21_14_2_50_40_13]
MKKLYIIALALITINGFAQVDRTKLPAPAPAKEIQIGDYEKFTLKNGLQVIVAENDKLPTVAWTLTFDQGPITEGEKSGLAGMFGQVMRAGTTSKNKEQLDEEIDFMGASLNVGASSISAFSLSKYSEDVLKLMSDVLFNPLFPQSELDKVKKQTITGLATSKDDPNAISGTVSAVVNYGKDHAFGEITTEETVNNVSLEDIKAHYTKFFKPNIAYLVIVGDIKKKDAQKLAEKYFGNWKSGTVNKETFQQPAPVEKTTVNIVDKPSAVQSVINITYPYDNKPGSKDATAVSVLNQVLGGSGSARLFTNLREDKGYTYGAYSSMGSSRYSATFSANASVRNEVTDSAMVEFLSELNRIREDLVSQEELDLAKNSLRGSFARSLENRGTVAQFALNTELNKLPADYYATYLKRLDAITAEDVRNAAKKYIKPDMANIVVVGKAEEIAPKLAKFGPVTYYDVEGNETADPTKAVVSDVTPEQILAKYIEAVGGKTAVESIKTMVSVSEGTLNMGPQSIKLPRTVYQKAPDFYADIQDIPMQGQMVQAYNSGEAFMKMGGQSQVLPATIAPLFKYQGVLFKERFYKDLGFETIYKGLSKIDGKDAHRIDVKVTDQITMSEFYDVATGFKVKIDMGAQGVMVLGDYREVNGVKIPFSLTQSGGQLPAPVNYITSDVKVNIDIDDKVFDK